VDDITGYPVRLHGETAYTDAEKQARQPRSPVPLATSRTDDDDYADILVRMWSLATGRIPRLDVRPDQLTKQELLWFWDDLTPAAGRHAKTRPVPSGAAR
jgi:hypothetical protein